MTTAHTHVRGRGGERERIQDERKRGLSTLVSKEEAS